jgi:hypothetical protein
MRMSSRMRENYCFKCGSYTRVEDLTKLCDRCYRGWLDRRVLYRFAARRGAGEAGLQRGVIAAAILAASASASPPSGTQMTRRLKRPDVTSTRTAGRSWCRMQKS